MKNNIKPLFAVPLFITLLFSISVSSAEGVSLKHRPEVTLQANRLDHRVCLYGGVEYSLGAILVVDSVKLECKPENDFESNGRLKWHRVKKKK